MNLKAQQLLNYLRVNGSTRSRALMEHFSIRSRATLSHRIQQIGDAVVTIGKASATSYAAKSASISELPLYRINANGKARYLGLLIPLAQGEWFLQSELNIASLFKGEFKDGLYPGWPWFLADLRPSGFLGRAFARRMSRLLDYDTNPENWSDQKVARALSTFGTNLHGDFIIGERALEEFLQEAQDHDEAYYANNGPHIYPELANRALEDGSSFGSSAGGEQPKFTTLVKPDGKLQNVIVKFSPPVDSPVGRRWGDLLIAEHIANQILSAHGHATAQTTIHEFGDRIFLQSERFDRIGATGRRGLVSLRALDAAFVGQGSGSWIKCAQRLKAAMLITPEDTEHVAQLWTFGNLIANTDMHFGNLSFYLDEDFPLGLAPCYDMLPMLFRPAPSGEIPPLEFTAKFPLPENEIAWNQMHPLALSFWKKVSTDPRISSDFKVIAAKSLSTLKQLKA